MLNEKMITTGSNVVCRGRLKEIDREEPKKDLVLNSYKMMEKVQDVVICLPLLLLLLLHKMMTCFYFVVILIA